MSGSAAQPQPIKAIAHQRFISQQQFAIDARLPYLEVNRVFNGTQRPSPQFIRKAVRYFDLSEDELFRPSTEARR